MVGGLKLGNVRLLASLDYALTKNVMLGLRAGYVLRTDPASPAFPPCTSRRGSRTSSAATP